MYDTPKADTRSPLHAKTRILNTAEQLFYRDGVHTVGIDKLITETGVTKATFYKYYPSKDDLILAYIDDKDQQLRQLLSKIAEEHSSPKNQLEALVQEIAQEAKSPNFRGCPFLNLTAQYGDPKHPVRKHISQHRDWYTEQIENLFRSAGHSSPGDATDDFFLARDGAFAQATLGDPIAATTAYVRSTDKLLSEISG